MNTLIGIFILGVVGFFLGRILSLHIRVNMPATWYFATVHGRHNFITTTSALITLISIICMGVSAIFIAIGLIF